MKENLLERELEIKALKINNKNLKASAKNYAKQLKIKDLKFEQLERDLHQVSVASQTKPEVSHQIENNPNFPKTLPPSIPCKHAILSPDSVLPKPSPLACRPSPQLAC